MYYSRWKSRKCNVETMVVSTLFCVFEYWQMVAEVASLRHIVDYHSAMFDLVSLQLGELANATGANVIKRSLCNATTTQVACWD